MVDRQITDPSGRASATSDARQFVSQFAGASLLFVVGINTLYWTIRRSRALENQVAVAREGQVTERFSRAIDQIGATNSDGSPNVATRAGGFVVLARIATESVSDRAPIIEIASEYIRAHARVPWPTDEEFYLHTPRSVQWELIEEDATVYANARLMDVTAALALLNRFLPTSDPIEGKALRLDSTFLREHSFAECVLAGTDFSSSNLRGIDFSGAVLFGSNFDYAMVRSAKLTRADLREASLKSADFTEANFEGADLRGADLSRGQFRHGRFKGALLQGALVDHADFEYADLDDIDISVEKIASLGGRTTPPRPLPPHSPPAPIPPPR